MVELKLSVIFSILFAWPSMNDMNHLIIKINTLSVTPAGPHCASASKFCLSSYYTCRRAPAKSCLPLKLLILTTSPVLGACKYWPLPIYIPVW